MEILEKAQKMLKRHPLCDHCLGRQFALLGYGLDNQERGATLKLLLTMKGHQLALSKRKSGIALLKTLAANGSLDMAVEILKKLGKRPSRRQQCYLCEGAFNAIPELVHSALKKLNDHEFSSFLVGIELPIEVEEREDEFKAELEVKHGESMRNDFSREMGKEISKVNEKTADYKRPEIVVLVKPFSGEVRLQVNPLFIAGRYRKLVRGIPQSRWLCATCRGKGCQQCKGTGKMYQESVEEIIGEPTLKIAEGEAIAFHGAGREDIDARMLGQGRPFVIEIKRPKKRFFDLLNLAQTINERAKGKVEVSKLRLATKDTVRKLKKTEAAQKLYKVIVEFDKSMSKKRLTELAKTLTNTVIRQQTPKRVLHRRADLFREKHIYKAKIKRLKPRKMEMRVQCQGGLYIKELITGDEGRTSPSVAEILDVKAKPLELDVLEVIVKKEERT
ncbi:MAG: tRNA pseudouridine(54/55) synthase Pus10 [Candidatus Bathyarchaeota archaeon]